MRSVTRTPSTTKKSLGPALGNGGGRVDLETKHNFIVALSYDCRLTSAAKAVAAYLLERFNDEANSPKCVYPGYAWPALLTIADRTGLSHFTVLRAIKQLKDLGYFVVADRRKGSHQPNLYRPIWRERPTTRLTETTSADEPSRRSSRLIRDRKLGSQTQSTRLRDEPLFHSIKPSKDSISGRAHARIRSADAVGKKVKRNGHDPDPTAALTLNADLPELVCGEPINRTDGYRWFLRLWPRGDASPDHLLKGAWFGNVQSDEIRSVLCVALFWNRFAKLFPDEFVPHAGRWLLGRGWRNDPPYGCDGKTLEALEDALGYHPSEPLAAVDAVAEEHLRSPFKTICKLGKWPDQDFQIARNAFNAVLAKDTYSAELIVKMTKRFVLKSEQARRPLPLLGLWIKQRFAGDDEDENDDSNDVPARYERRVVVAKEDEL